MIQRDIIFPHPVYTKRLMLKVVVGAPVIDLKIDLLGEKAADTEEKDTTFQPSWTTRGA